MDLTPALKNHKKIDIKNFFEGFNRIFKESFHEDDLLYWSDITGVKFEEAKSNLSALNWIELSQGVYVNHQIETLDNLKRLCELYNISKSEILQKVTLLLKLHNGNLTLISTKIPLTINLLNLLLSLQNEMILLGSHWVPVKNVPEAILKFSKINYCKKLGWKDFIVSTFIVENKPLKIEELIYRSFGMLFVSGEIKALLIFMLNILNVTKVRDTEFWILKEWECKIDSNLISSINSFLNEKGISTVSDIIYCLKDYNETEIRESLSFWPEFKECDNDSYKLNFSQLNEEIVKEIIPFIQEKLSSNENGITIADLFSYTIKILEPLGININLFDFKLFLKGWGEVAIIGNRVYDITVAPYNQMRLGDVAYLILKEYGSPVPYTELEAEIRSARNYSASISSVLLTEPKLSRPSRGYWALKEWGLSEYDPHLHLRIGYELVSIIEKMDRPVHKAELHQQLRKKGMNMNATTLYLDLNENEEIVHVARGVYSLKKWNLSFRDLFRFKFPFKLALPDNNPTIYEIEDGVMVEYFISKQCLDYKRILINRYLLEYFNQVEQYARYQITDFEGSIYDGWIDCLSDGRYQILGLERWYHFYKPKYGESIYIFIPSEPKKSMSLFSEDQANIKLFG